MHGVLSAHPKPWILSSLTSHNSGHHYPPCRYDTNPLSFVSTSVSAAGSGGRIHSSACPIGKTGSIWHAILPSGEGGCERSKWVSVFHHELKGEGSWNAGLDVRPARWLHSSDSAWLLFGVCGCLAVSLDCCFGVYLEKLEEELRAAKIKVADAAGVGAGTGIGSGPVVDCTVDGVIPVDVGGDDLSVEVKRLFDEEVTEVAKEEKEVKRSSVDYRVTGVTADGRCLFRALSYGSCVKRGEKIPSEDRQKELADDLRAKVVDELLKRRKETEWFIEGDFDEYVKSIQRPNAWGGEPELLMASHVLQMSISVFMIDKSSCDLIHIASYGEEYGKDENPIKVVFHGYGHYDVLETFSDKAS